MNRQVGEGVARGATNILGVERIGVGLTDAAAGAEDDAGLERRQVDAQAAGGHRVDDFLGDDSLDAGAADVDERRLAGDRDGLSDLADLHVGVDGDDAVSADLDGVALEGVEPLQRERHRVSAGHELNDLELAGAVGDGGPGFLDESWARNFDGNARQHCAGGVFGDSSDSGLLGEGCGWHERQTQECASEQG